jgi:hypothetical protein
MRRRIALGTIKQREYKKCGHGGKKYVMSNKKKKKKKINRKYTAWRVA